MGQARLQRRESVKLATEEDFNEMVGVLRLIEQEGEEPANDKPIGWMSYVGEFHDDLSHEKACYQLDVKIPRRRFNALMVAVNQGKLPSQISVETEGMIYDWQPDGSGKVWDNKTSPQIPIVSIWFITPLIGGDPRDFLDDRSPEDGMPPSRAQLNQVTFVLNELKTKFESVHSELYWVVILLVAMLAVLLWRYR